MKNLARLGLLLSLTVTNACGKADNVHEPVLVEFPHSFPEAPRALDRTVAPAWTAGHPLAVSAAHIFIADRDNRELVRLERTTLKREAALSLGGRPEQIAIGEDGAIFVSMRNGEVLRVSQQLVIEARRALGSDVFGLALSPDATTLYATLPFERELHTLDVADLGEVAAPVALLDTPRGVVASPEGWLLVVHQFAGALKILVDSDNLPIDTIAETPLRNANPADHLEGLRLAGLHAVRAITAAVSPEDGSAFIAHVTAAPGTEADFLQAGSASVNGSEVVSTDGYGASSAPSASFPIPTRPVEATVTATDPGGMTRPSESDFPVQDVLTGEPMLALVDQPSDIAHHPTWSLLFVTGYGSDNVLVLSTGEAGADPARSPLAVIEVGHAPRGIAFSPDGAIAYVLNEHQLTVSAIDLTPFFRLETMADGHPVFATGGAGGSFSTEPGMPMPSAAMDVDTRSFVVGSDPTPDSARVRPFRLQAGKTAAWGTDPLPASVRNGARTYTFARNENLSHAGQFACGTCHFEGGEDKLVWFITDGPRQTPALAGRLLGTEPFNWGGTKDALKDNMSQTIERMGGTGLSERELVDLEQFLLYGLEAPKNPNLAPDGQLTPTQLAGKALFEDKTVGCSSCHRPEQNFTDGFVHDVGTASKAELTRFEFDRALDPDAQPSWRLNTPTLKGLFYTAPYLHDGSAATLHEVFERTGESMGKTRQLTPEQKDQLVQYLLTL